MSADEICKEMYSFLAPESYHNDFAAAPVPNKLSRLRSLYFTEIVQNC